MAPDIEAWLNRGVGDAALRRAAAGLDLPVAIVAPSLGRWRLTLSPAPSWKTDDGLGDDEGAVVIEARPETWRTLLTAPVPAPGWQSFGALIRLNPGFRIAGAPLRIAQGLAALERLIELTHADLAPLPAPPARRDPALPLGRSKPVTAADGAEACLHWQEAGDGTPLVMLHTAGADSRQYAHQLSDLELAAGWRMLAFDMPGHGRSAMPADWTAGSPYQLTLAGYRDWCAAFLEQVVGRPAVIMGCSMGAAMALVLAAHRPDLVAGVVALEAPWRAPGRRSPFLADARVNASLHNPAYVRALLGPLSPAAFRDEACWIYSQAGFGVYSGDLAFYSEEFDGTAIAATLAAASLPIHLLTGEYDYSASPDNTRQMADAIGHATFTVMRGLGHFPMIEHPDHFRTYLLAALADIRRRLGHGG